MNIMLWYRSGLQNWPKCAAHGLSREEVEEVRRNRDPIDHVQELLTEKGWADEAALKAIDADVRAIVADAAEFARISPEPDPAELFTDIYVGAAR